MQPLFRGCSWRSCARSFVLATFWGLLWSGALLRGQSIRLDDITAGGDGSGNAPVENTGIDPITGEVKTTYWNGRLRDLDSFPSATPVPESPFIDSVFFIGPVAPCTSAVCPEFHIQPITQSGVMAPLAASHFTGSGWNYILRDRVGGVSTPGIHIAGRDFEDAVGIHASMGISYDLDVLRAQYGEAAVGCFSTFWGMDGCASGRVELHVILSNDSSGVIDLHKKMFLANQGEFLAVEIPLEARYLTLASGSLGSDNCDHGTFARPRISPSPCPLEEPRCDAHWSAMPVAPGEPVASMVVFDDGSGPSIFAALKAVKRWDGQSWHAVGAPFDDYVVNLSVSDLGDGPALYAAGYFTYVGATMVNGIARWDGAAWHPLAGGVGPVTLSPVFDLETFDDGSGPALYATGSFTTAGGVPARNIARWDGVDWAPIGSGLVGGSLGCFGYALAVYDDGSGPALYVGGLFITAGGVPAMNIARWNGVSWSSVGGGTSDWVAKLRVHDDGSGPALYATGSFTSAGGVPASHIARWDGTSWSPLGAGLSGYSAWTDDLLSFDYGAGPSLFVSGTYIGAGSGIVNGIAEWHAGVWTSLDTGLWVVPKGLPARAFAMAVTDLGAGPQLFAGGVFDTAGGVASPGMARWSFAGGPWARGIDRSAGCEGDAIVLTAHAAGLAPLTYTWRKDGVELPGVTGETLTLSPATAEDSGTYDFTVTNDCGHDHSSALELLVEPCGG